MAVKVGNSWVSEAALAYAKEKVNESSKSSLEELSKQYPDINFSTNIAPFSQKGVKNIQIAPNILTEMQNDPEKRLEYEALIYDCATGIEMLNHSGGGFHTRAAGFIINPDGSLGAWGISVSDDGKQARSRVSLDKGKKETWAEKIRAQQMEKQKKAQEQKKADDRKAEKRKAEENFEKKDLGVVYTMFSDLDILKTLQKKVTNVQLETGFGLNTKRDNKIGTITLNPKLLEKMQNNPEAEKKYTQTIKDIERAEMTVGAYYNALGGVVERCSHWYIDENGKYCHFGFVRRDDKLNQKLRKEAQKNAEKLIEKTRENAHNKSEQLAEKLEENFQNTKELTDYLKQNFHTIRKGMVSISGKYLKDCLSDEEKRRQLFDNLEAADDMEANAKDNIKGYQGMKIEIDENGDMTTKTYGGAVAFNEGKRARQLAAAKTPENVQTVMGILQKDLADCQAGLESGMCDENEVNKVKAMMAKAQQRLGEVSALGDKDNDADENAFAMSMLM